MEIKLREIVELLRAVKQWPRRSGRTQEVKNAAVFRIWFRGSIATEPCSLDWAEAVQAGATKDHSSRSWCRV